MAQEEAVSNQWSAVSRDERKKTPARVPVPHKTKKEHLAISDHQSVK
jgi:hypothetical protein